MDLQNAEEIRMIYNALNIGNKCLHAQQDDIELDNIDILIEDTQEAIQLSDTISQRLGKQDLIDSDINIYDLSESQLEKEFGILFDSKEKILDSNTEYNDLQDEQALKQVCEEVQY